MQLFCVLGSLYQDGTLDFYLDICDQGMIGIVISHRLGEPLDNTSAADIQAAERFNQFVFGWFANPIYGSGDYPDVMKWQIGNKSMAQGFKTSRLPEFSSKEKQMILGSYDFLGYNFYTEDLIQAIASPLTPPGYVTDLDVAQSQDDSWKTTDTSWLRVTPWAIRRGLNWVRSHYNNVPVYITENGVSDRTGTLHDQHRVDFYKAYINEVLKAIRLDGCDVRGYSAWSFLDNFEWLRGFSERFGLHYVNFSDPQRPRTPKLSASFYRSIIENNGLVKAGNETKSQINESNPLFGVEYVTTPDSLIFNVKEQSDNGDNFYISFTLLSLCTVFLLI